MKKEHKVVWVRLSSNINQSPVRLTEKYMNLLPKEGTKPNFYLQSLRKFKPYCWYSTMPVGINSLHKVVGELLKNGGLDGFFTNHSLRCTCATHLFQAGADVKIVKEITGHVSDAVHKYQTTSDEQCMNIGKNVQGGVQNIKLLEAVPMEVVEEPCKSSVDDKLKLPKLKLPISGEKEATVVGAESPMQAM